MNDDRPVLAVVGSVNEDTTVFASAIPRPGETVLGDAVRRDPGGKGANQAVAAARLGGRSRFIGAIGRDDAGDRMIDALVDAGVDVDLVQRVDAPTGQAHIVVDAAGENTIVVIAGANDAVEVPPVLVGPVLCQLEVPLPVAVAAAVSTRGWFGLNAAPAQRLPPELVERCDLMIVNESEYEALPELRGARLVVVTLGAAGAVAYERGEEVARAGGQRVDVVSSVGAGDAFCAAAALAITGGESLERSLLIACAVGAAAVASPDARPPLATLERYAAAPQGR